MNLILARLLLILVPFDLTHDGLQVEVRGA
jgi:hypothetical protein